MPLTARRIFRLSLTVALSLAGAYALRFPMPFLTPLFALMLSATSAPPLRLKSLVGLSLLIMLILGVGLLLIPLLRHYPASAVMIIVVGLVVSNTLSINKGKGLAGALLTAGLTLISAAGMAGFALAVMVIQALVLSIVLAITCQWVVYPWLPEDPVPGNPPKAPEQKNGQSRWIALRATLIVLPAYLLALTNPAMYLSIIMKAVSLGQQGSMMSAHHAGRELLGSTFLGGCFAILFWIALGLFTHLWMFFLWMVLFGIYFSCKLYGQSPSRLPPSFWQNTFITMLILLGPAVEDSANGKDVYLAFAVRMGLFVAVTVYAWAAIIVLEAIRNWRARRVLYPVLLKRS